jgi:hypothetical protein
MTELPNFCRETFGCFGLFTYFYLQRGEFLLLRATPLTVIGLTGALTSGAKATFSQ